MLKTDFRRLTKVVCAPEFSTPLSFFVRRRFAPAPRWLVACIRRAFPCAGKFKEAIGLHSHTQQVEIRATNLNCAAQILSLHSSEGLDFIRPSLSPEEKGNQSPECPGANAGAFFCAGSAHFYATSLYIPERET
jgi:hypothetical protein